MSPAWQKWMQRLLPRPWRNWLRNPRATARWLGASWGWWRGGGVELDCGAGLVLRCHPASARTFRWFIEDDDSIAELHAFRAALTPAVRVYDLGAHYGFFSLAALALAGPRARVLAVEPSAAAYRVLSANLKLAGGGDRAQALHAAVGAADGQLAMLSGGINSENYMFASAADRPDAIRVRQCSLAGLARACGWTPALIKIDIEGFEKAVLTNAENLEALRAWRAPLFLELHNAMLRQADPGDGDAGAEILSALAGAGYGILRWRGQAVTAAQVLRAPIARVCVLPAD